MRITFTPADERVEDLFRLEVHEAAFEALIESGAITDGHLDPDRLEAWADGCDNPDGQRATLARALAQLRRLSPLTISRT